MDKYCTSTKSYNNDEVERMRYPMMSEFNKEAIVYGKKAIFNAVYDSFGFKFSGKKAGEITLEEFIRNSVDRKKIPDSLSFNDIATNLVEFFAEEKKQFEESEKSERASEQ